MAKKKILLVDDEADFSEIIGARIEEWGYTLTKALDGAGALEALKSDKPDIIILDYMMPNMDGIATLKEIRKIDKDIPVIMFTAYPEKPIKSIAGLGISAFIPKLSTYSDVQASLKTAIDMIGNKLVKKG